MHSTKLIRVIEERHLGQRHLAERTNDYFGLKLDTSTCPRSFYLPLLSRHNLPKIRQPRVLGLSISWIICNTNVQEESKAKENTHNIKVFVGTVASGTDLKKTALAATDNYCHPRNVLV